MKNSIIKVQDIPINISNCNEKDYICISDIAFEFASSISPIFKLYLIKEY